MYDVCVRTPYRALMQRRNEILSRALGIDYDGLEQAGGGFDHLGLLDMVGLDLDEIRQIQGDTGVGRTPMIELHNITELVRRQARPGKGARILIKDEAANPSGSFKDRRASLSAHHASRAAYPGMVAATSGNYGAGVASQAARYGLRAIVIQEAFDSKGRGQPEILEKGRKCEALGAEVIQTTVGPELFYLLLGILDDTGYFNASLYTPFSVRGIETLGAEIVEDTRALCGRDPAVVLATHAGGGMVTGTARGMRAVGAERTRLVGVSVDLRGLHMASDRAFNRKSFTTGHSGFSIPFTSWPDRVDVPRNAARPLRYLDRFVLVTQGEVLFSTELLARAEGLERGPAGNTSLAAAIPLAAELDRDQVLVISETEYTGAGKAPTSQLAFAAEMGVAVENGSRHQDRPGEVIAIPLSLQELDVTPIDLDELRRSYLKKATTVADADDATRAFVAEDVGVAVDDLDALVR